MIPIKYLGSKSRIAKHIVPILQKEIDDNNINTYIEPFCGGCNLIDKIECDKRIANDNNPYLIALLDHVARGGGYEIRFREIIITKLKSLGRIMICLNLKNGNLVR